jgi:hypothetical protein
MFTNSISTTSLTTTVLSFLQQIRLDAEGNSAAVQPPPRKRGRSASPEQHGERMPKRARSESPTGNEEPAMVWRELQNYQSIYPQFGLYNHVSKFVLRTMSAHPEEDLKAIFATLIERAIKSIPNKAGFGIISKGPGHSLTDFPS